MPTLPAGEIERVFRADYGRAVAVLARVFSSINAAEEAVQDAFTVALERWPTAGLPPSPAGWIITTARNRAIDRLRRESSREELHAQAVQLHSYDAPGEADAVEDDRLRLIFTCCHPSLAMSAQVALTLRLLGGLTTAEIARLPRHRSDDGAAAGSRESQDPRRRHSVPSAGGGRTACASPRGARGHLLDLQRGPHGVVWRRTRA